MRCKLIRFVCIIYCGSQAVSVYWPDIHRDKPDHHCQVCSPYHKQSDSNWPASVVTRTRNEGILRLPMCQQDHREYQEKGSPGM